MDEIEGKRDISKYLSVAERYYSKKYFINPSCPGEDVCIMVHSNKICVVTLAERHPILTAGKTVTSVDYQFDRVNRLCNTVTGKGKKGAQVLNAASSLCRVSCDDGSQYYIPCGMKCQLLETNDTLKNYPTALTEKTYSDGYIAVVLPKLKEYTSEMNKLLTKEDYTSASQTST